MPEVTPIHALQPALNADVYRRMRTDILTGELMPNARLRLEALRARYAVGATPIREALMRLEAEGLVQLEHNRGFTVAGVSEEQLVDLARTRIEIETTALRWSIERADLEWEAELLAAFHRLSRQSKIESGQPPVISAGWRTEHRRFHFATVSACGSPLLLEIRARLFDQAERYVALSIACQDRPRDDLAEHQAIMEAALNRDVEKALTLNREHIERTAAKVAMVTRIFAAAGGKPRAAV